MRGCAGSFLRAATMVALLLLASGARAAFDHGHAAWTALLARHLVLVDGGRASRVDYAGFARDRAALKAYLAALGAVPEPEFRGWTRAEQAAFLINAYNAYTVEKVLTRHPGLASIRDFGRLIGNPFRDRFFVLLGRPASLDDIEHGMLRQPGSYDEVRVHYALNCASLGCPMLREEAYAAARLERQLEEQARRFLSDRSRNRYNARTGVLEVSRIFDWYGGDWTRGWRGLGAGEPIHTLGAYLARYAPLLADDPAHRERIAAGQVEIRFLEYDWRLNDAAGR